MSKCEPNAEGSACYYTLTIEAQGTGSALGKTKVVSRDYDVTQFFDDKGFCHYLPI